MLKHDFSKEKLCAVYNSINLKAQTIVYNELTKRKVINKKQNHIDYFFGKAYKNKKSEFTHSSDSILKSENN